MASARSQQPSASAASATRPASSTRSIRSPAPPRAPIHSAGRTPSKHQLRHAARARRAWSAALSASPCASRGTSASEPASVATRKASAQGASSAKSVLAREPIALFAHTRALAARPALVRRDREAGVAGGDARQPLARDGRARGRERHRRHHGGREEGRRRAAKPSACATTTASSSAEPAAAEGLRHQHAGHALLRERAPQLAS